MGAAARALGRPDAAAALRRPGGGGGRCRAEPVDARPQPHAHPHRRRRRRGHERDRDRARPHGPPRQRLRPKRVAARSSGSGCSASTAHVGHDGRRTCPADARRGRDLDRDPRDATPRSSPRASAGIPVLRRADALRAIVATRARDRGRGHPRQDHDVVDARADPARPRAGTRASSSAASSTRSAPTPRTTTASGWWSRPTRATARSSSSRAEAAIVTNVEPDHLDHYGDFAALVEAFATFVAGVPGPCVALRRRRRRAARSRPRGAGAASPTASPTTPTTGSSDYDGRPQRHASSRSTRRRRAARRDRAAGARAAQRGRTRPAPRRWRLELGVPFDAVARALGGFGGVARRFQFRGELDGVTLVDDYAHLPARSPRRSAPRARAAGTRVVAVFQPHRYRAPRALWRDFADAFVGADQVVLTDVYAAGEAARSRRVGPAGRCRRCSTPTPSSRSRTSRAAPTSSTHVPRLTAARRRRAHARRRRPHHAARRVARRRDAREPDAADARRRWPSALDARRARCRSSRDVAGRRAHAPTGSAARSRCSCGSAPTPTSRALAEVVAEHAAAGARRRARLEPPRRRRRLRRASASCSRATSSSVDLDADRTRVAGRRRGRAPGAGPPRGRRRASPGSSSSSGIPGTVGGAVRMNAGGHGRETARRARRRRASSTSPGRRRRTDRRPVGRARLGYRTRGSARPTSSSAPSFAVGADDPARVRGRASTRSCAGGASTSPAARTRARCSRNPPGDSAGRLIDARGLQGAAGRRRGRSPRSTPTSSRPRPARPPTTCARSCARCAGGCRRDRRRAGARAAHGRLRRRRPRAGARGHAVSARAAGPPRPRRAARRRSTPARRSARRRRRGPRARRGPGGARGRSRGARRVSPLLDVDHVEVARRSTGVTAAEVLGRAAGIARGRPDPVARPGAGRARDRGAAVGRGARRSTRELPGTVRIEVTERRPGGVGRRRRRARRWSSTRTGPGARAGRRRRPPGCPSCSASADRRPGRRHDRARSTARRGRRRARRLRRSARRASVAVDRPTARSRSQVAIGPEVRLGRRPRRSRRRSVPRLAVLGALDAASGAPTST